VENHYTCHLSLSNVGFGLHPQSRDTWHHLKSLANFVISLLQVTCMSKYSHEVQMTKIDETMDFEGVFEKARKMRENLCLM
jgi:hypothetical protein